MNLKFGSWNVNLISLISMTNPQTSWQQMLTCALGIRPCIRRRQPLKWERRVSVYHESRDANDKRNSFKIKCREKKKLNPGRRVLRLTAGFSSSVHRLTEGFQMDSPFFLTLFFGGVKPPLVEYDASRRLKSWALALAGKVCGSAPTTKEISGGICVEAQGWV